MAELTAADSMRRAVVLQKCYVRASGEVHMASRTAARGATAKAKKKASKPTSPASSAADWRDELLGRMRALIFEACPEMIEERKWRKPSNGMVGVPVWSRDGIVCTGERYTKAVKLTFARGASLADPARLFNASLEGNTRRAIDLSEGAKIDAGAFKALVKASVALNAAKQRPTRARP